MTFWLRRLSLGAGPRERGRVVLMMRPRWRLRLRRFSQRAWAVARWEYVEFPRELARIARESLRGGER